MRNLLRVLLPSVALVACVEDSGNGSVFVDVTDAPADQTGAQEMAPGGNADVAPLPDVVCPTEPVETLVGTASRDNDAGYPDHINVIVTWRLSRTIGCVDTYLPEGSANYRYDIPGALCSQSITPASHAIAAADGELVIDRSAVTPTYSGHAATQWPVTHHCVYEDGTSDDYSFEGGAVWFDGSGTLGAAVEGTETIEDDSGRCGPEGIAPCTYRWSFAPSAS